MAAVMVIEKAQETEIKLPTSSGSSKKQESSRKINSATVYTVSLSICHEVMGPDAMILIF